MRNVSYFDVEGLRSLQGFLTPIHTGMNAKHSLHVTDSLICINNIVLGKRLHWVCACHVRVVIQTVCYSFFFLDVKQQVVWPHFSKTDPIPSALLQNWKNTDFKMYVRHPVNANLPIFFTLPVILSVETFYSPVKSWRFNLMETYRIPVNNLKGLRATRHWNELTVFQKRVFISNNCIINWNVQHKIGFKYSSV